MTSQRALVYMSRAWNFPRLMGRTRLTLAEDPPVPFLLSISLFHHWGMSVAPPPTKPGFTPSKSGPALSLCPLLSHGASEEKDGIIFLLIWLVLLVGLAAPVTKAVTSVSKTLSVVTATGRRLGPATCGTGGPTLHFWVRQRRTCSQSLRKVLHCCHQAARNI